MVDDINNALVFFFKKQQQYAEAFAIWLLRIMKPPTPTYVPKYPMTVEEQERVRPHNEEEEK